MNQGGCESQKNMAVDQKQYPDEAVGTRNTCKIKERRGGNRTKPRTDKVLLMASLQDMTEFTEMHVIMHFKLNPCINNSLHLTLFEHYYHTVNFTSIFNS